MIYYNGSHFILIGNKTHIIKHNKIITMSRKMEVPNNYVRFISSQQHISGNIKNSIITLKNKNFTETFSDQEPKNVIITEDYYRITDEMKIYFKLLNPIKLGNLYYYNFKLESIFAYGNRFYYTGSRNIKCKKKIPGVSLGTLPRYLIQLGELHADFIGHDKTGYFQFERQIGNYFIGNVELFLFLEMMFKLLAISLPKCVRYFIYQFIKIDL